MKILAVDSSLSFASCALLNEKSLICEMQIDNGRTHGEVLADQIDKMMKQTNIEMSSIDALAVTSGPGSFTGLRIGAAVVKSIAYALNKDIFAVPTLDALAYNIFDQSSTIVPIIDAKRQLVYTATYKYTDKNFFRTSEYMTLDILALIEQLSDQKVIFLGDAVSLYKEKIENFKNFTIAPFTMFNVRAASVGQLVLSGQYEKINQKDFSPFYLKLSQADEALKK